MEEELIIPGNNSPADPSGDEGKVTIDWSKVDPTSIPTDVVKKTEAFQEVLGESIDRRKTISTLNTQIEELKKVAETPEPENDPVEETPTNDVNTEVLKALQSVNARLDALDKAQTETTRQGWVAAALKEAGLPKKAAEYIKGDTAAEITASASSLAEMLGTNKPQDFSKGGGDGISPSDLTTLQERVRDRIQGKNTTGNPFDPGVQRQKGGGPQVGKNPFFDFE